MRYHPRPYQQRFADFALATPKCAGWISVGLGKTAATLAVIKTLLDACEVNRVLVLAPLRVAKFTWPNECAKWSDFSGLRVVSIAGCNEKQRCLGLASPADVVFCNFENLEWLIGLCSPAHWPFDMVVIDEASAFKSHSTKRFKALRRALPKIDRLIELTASPAPNSLLNLWPQVFLLDRGQRLGRTFTSYRDTFFDGDYMGFKYEPKPGAPDAIYNAVADVCMTLRAEDWLDLPPVVNNRIEVRLEPGARKQYDELEKHFYTELADGEITAQNAAVKAGKLLQFVGGTIYNQERGRHRVSFAKQDALAELVDQLNGQPLIVAYAYQHQFDELREAFPQAVEFDTDPATLARFRRGEIPVLLLHPQSAGHGVDGLQDNCHNLCWYSLPWSLEQYEQTNGRIGPARQLSAGTGKHPVIHHLIAVDTIDEAVTAALLRKDAQQSALLDEVKNRRGNK